MIMRLRTMICLALLLCSTNSDVFNKTQNILISLVIFQIPMSMSFDGAAQAVKQLTYKPTNEQLLDLYGLYKQATIGDICTRQPSMLAMKERAKWSAWEQRKGMRSTEARTRYVALVQTLLAIRR
jgi:diazepam-binding inhibitor (GABA receptor modulator, acyl-CoA-binding protein)